MDHGAMDHGMMDHGAMDHGAMGHEGSGSGTSRLPLAESAMKGLHVMAGSGC